MIRITMAVAAAAIAAIALATPASAGTKCYTPHVGPYPTVEMCINLPDPGPLQ